MYSFNPLVDEILVKCASVYISVKRLCESVAGSDLQTEHPIIIINTLKGQS